MNKKSAYQKSRNNCCFGSFNYFFKSTKQKPPHRESDEAISAAGGMLTRERTWSFFGASSVPLQDAERT